MFYEKQTFINLTLLNFHKRKEELTTEQDKWLYLFCHLHTLTTIPSQFNQQVFVQLFEQAKIAKFEPKDQQAYENSLKYYRDLKNVIETARGESS